MPLGRTFLVGRATRERIAEATARLTGDAGAGDNGIEDLETALNRLDRAATGAVEQARSGWAAAHRLAQALDSLPLGVVVYDKAGEVVLCNQAACPIVDARGPHALSQRSMAELLPAAMSGRAESQTLELYGPPRQTLTITVRPLADGSGEGGATAVIEDVSERRRLEAVRRDFVANISHELKTPVGALALLAETLAVEDDPSVISRLALRLHSEAQRVGRLIDDLLDLSRIEAEEAPLRELVPVHVVVAQSVDRVRPLADMREVEIAVDEASPRLSVIGDRRQLVSAVHNLIENAVKYSEAGSTVRLLVETDGRSVELGVHDCGIGIPAQDLERIFERFYRVDHARARDTGGTGLGLSIVRHVAGNHGGEVRVTSVEGEGSSFTLRLPAGPGPAGGQHRRDGMSG